MPRKAELPTAAPVHDGAGVDVAAEAAVLVAFRLKAKTELSDNVKEKFWPDPDRAAASL
jgi:hypothetical protein